MANTRYNRKRATRRGGSKRKRAMRVHRPLGQTPIHIKRTFWNSNWSPNTTTTDGFWKYFTFALSYMPSYLEVTNLFEVYKLNRIKVTFRPRYDSFAGNDTTDTTLPGVTNQGGTNMHVLIDPKSNLAPSGTYTSSTMNQLFELGNVKTYTGNKPFSVYFKPTVDMTVGAVTNGRRIPAPFIQSAIPSILHNGFHVFAQDVNLTGVFGQSFDIFITYYMTVKGLK